MATPTKQLALPFGVAERVAVPHLEAVRRLRLSIEARIGEPVHLTVTDNRHSMVTVKTRPDGVHAVRLHHMFLGADPHVVKQLARYIDRRDRKASQELGRFIAEHRQRLPTAPRRARSVLIKTRGRVHDLQTLFDALNLRYFQGGVIAHVTWGSAPRRPQRRRRRRSIKLGTYSMDDRLIRVHPSLDDDWIPPFFLEWIVFHEMLHQVFGVKLDESGRRSYHSAEFRERERTFEHYEVARRWEREHIDRLLGG